ITHRGPDDEGYFSDEHIQFGFRRLSIIDIESGKQPLSFENVRYWIIFNGEIYKFVELREELVAQVVQFATASDTEVIIALYSHMKEQAVTKLRGMFAFMIWDKENKELYGARNPFRIKPLFYKEKENITFFTSEKKSILLAMDESTLNSAALQQYMTYQFVPAPETMTTGINKL